MDSSKRQPHFRPLLLPLTQTVVLRCNFVAALASLVTGCSALTTPVLRQETGETLGQGRLRASAQLETGRIVPVVPAAVALAAVGNTQDSGIFSGLLFSLGGSYGVLPTTDIQLRTFYPLSGGGWRIGLKQQIIKGSNLAVAGMVGYGHYAAKGNYTINTGSPTEVDTVMSASQVDFSIPVSYRLGSSVWVYSGFNVYMTSLIGVANTEADTASATDLGVNLGVKIKLSPRYDLSLEGAMLLSAGGPFGSEVGHSPYFGLGLGVLF